MIYDDGKAKREKGKKKKKKAIVNSHQTKETGNAIFYSQAKSFRSRATNEKKKKTKMVDKNTRPSKKLKTTRGRKGGGKDSHQLNTPTLSTETNNALQHPSAAGPRNKRSIQIPSLTPLAPYKAVWYLCQGST